MKKNDEIEKLENMFGSNAFEIRLGVGDDEGEINVDLGGDDVLLLTWLGSSICTKPRYFVFC